MKQGKLLLITAILATVIKFTDAKDITYPDVDVTGKKNLVVSLAGAGVWAKLMQMKGVNTAVSVTKVLTRTNNVSFTGSITPDEVRVAKSDDQITEIANNFINHNTVTMTGYPWLFGNDPDINVKLDIDCEEITTRVCVDNFLTLGSGFLKFSIKLRPTCFDVKIPDPTTCEVDLKIDAINDSWWGPRPKDLAAKIEEYVLKMNPDHKVILIGKSMGGCILYKTAQKLAEKGINVDLLILVDASCNINYHSGETLQMPSNVKNVINIRQDNRLDDQNGYQVSFPYKGKDIIVNKYNSYVNKQLCLSDVNHASIDECAGVLELIKQLVRAEIAGNINAILNLLLDN
jgi:hypothetical protein